ncbi:MAG: hypothetical protein JWQ11_2399 [Rhizobacter sp.]|nr:hypothetical protein [Rhizobacter sp.]
MADHAGPAYASRTAAVIPAPVPPRLGPLSGARVGFRGDPGVYRAGSPLGDLSVCDDGASIGRVIAKYPGIGLKLVKQAAPDLLARIAGNEKLDLPVKLADLKALVQIVGRHGGKVDFVSHRGQLQLRAIVDGLRLTPGIHPHHIAEILTSLEDLPKAVSSMQARMLRQQATARGERAPDFGIFEEMHANNHLAGEHGGVRKSDPNRYEYPNGAVFPVRTIRSGRPPRLEDYNGIRQAMPLGFAARHRLG